MCKESWALKDSERRYPHLEYRGLVKREDVDKWLREIVYLCGGNNSAARTLGVSSATLQRWLGQYRNITTKRIRRENVVLILVTLKALREGKIRPAATPRTYSHHKGFKYGCSSCGTPLNLCTPGCGTCTDRMRSRSRYAQQKETQTKNGEESSTA